MLISQYLTLFFKISFFILFFIYLFFTIPPFVLPFFLLFLSHFRGFGDMSNRFNSFKKGISKVKNISPKIKGNSNRKKNNSKNKRSKSTIEYIVPENSPLRKNSTDLDSDSGFFNSDYLDDLPEGVFYTRPVGDLPEGVSYTRPVGDLPEGVTYTHPADDSYDLDGVDKRYAKYIFGDDLSDRNFKDPRDSSYMEDLDNNDGLNNEFGRNRNFHKSRNYADKRFNNDLDNNGENYKNDSYLDESYSDFSFKKDLDNGYLNGDAYLSNSDFSDFDKDYLDDSNFKNSHSKKASLKSNGIKNKLLNFKDGLLNKDDNSKSRFGKIVFILIFLVLASSMFYFFVYQPFQDELNLEKNAKLNELNTLYKGPLEAHENAYILKNQIESENDINELKKIDILMYATKDWRTYHKSKIVSSKDNFGRVMLAYGDENKNLIMSVKDANEFVADNDGRVLSNIQFEKVDTIIVPVSISRLQASAGLISVGSIVDIYSLKDNYSYGSDEESNLESSSALNESSEGLEENQSEDNEDLGGGEDISKMPVDSNPEEDSGFSQNGEPDVSGATVLAILRSKDSGVIDSSISKSNTLVEGNLTDPYENTSSYSNDVEELLKASVFNSYDDNKALEYYLNSYGIKLSNYERMSNLADLDSEYLVLLEVPRSDVSFVINNMDNLILTIPTEFAPNWVIGELNETYYDNIYNYDLNSSSFI